MKRAYRRVFVVLSTGVLVLAGLGWLWQSRPGYLVEPGPGTVAKAYANHWSGVMAEVQGEVVRLLLDNRDGATQAFVIRLRNGQDLLILHDLGQADRVPVATGDLVTVRGEYDWSETGGTMRRTFRDHSLGRRHGWIEHKTIRYE